MSSDCIFCRIVAGGLPAVKVYEDADALAFLDIAPVTKGHTLVIPRGHHNPLMDTPPEVLQKLIIVVQKVARGLVAGLGAQGISLSQANGRLAGQVVPHIHFHLIPRCDDIQDVRHWTPGQYDSLEEMQALGERLRKAIG